VQEKRESSPTNQPLNRFDISPEIHEKMRKNLLYGFMFAVVMIFAGLTSGYIVSQGGIFWVSIKMPSAFMYSTLAIIASSLFLFLAKRFVKKGDYSKAKGSLGIAFVLGALFGVFQFQGWGQLSEKGSHLSGDIINIHGQYGKYYTLLYDGKEISYNDNVFYLKGEPISDELKQEMKDFAQKLVEGSKSEGRVYKLTGYGAPFSLRYDGDLITYANNTLQLNGVLLSEIYHDRLWHFAKNIVEDRGDFIIKGKYGEDFTLYYGGKPLEYENRKFYLDGLPLSAKRLNDLNSQRNTASSYIYAFTLVHLLHWIGGIIALLVMFIKGLQLKYTQNNFLGITLGSTYWHFLGIIWLYLYAFLIFIH
jgi:cytochrome c oxidase subunit 3